MKRIVIALGVYILASSPVFAQTITLEQVRTLALANSRSLAKSNLSIQSAALDEKARIYSTFPSLSLGASASMNLWNASNLSSGDSSSGDTFFDSLSTKLTFSVSQKLFEGGKSVIQKAINALESESVRKDALAEYFNVLDSADNAYYAVLEATATLEAEESSLQTAVISLSIAEVRQAHGIINRGDYLKALAEKETRENSRNQARRNLSLCITKLKALTGLTAVPELEQIDFSGYEKLIHFLGNISDEDTVLLYSEFWKLLAKENPSLAKAHIASQRAEKNISITRLGFLPSLNASFSTGLNYSPKKGLGMGGGSISLSANIPLDFWVTNNNIEKSKIARDSAALDYLNVESQLETELQSALINAFAMAGSVLSSRRSLDYAERHFEFVMERYRLSQSSVSDLGESSSLLINSQNNLTKATYGFLQSLSKLRSLGAVDDEERLLEMLMLQ